MNLGAGEFDGRSPLGQHDGSRSRLLRQPGGAEDRYLTQTKQPPANPGRFTTNIGDEQTFRLGKSNEQKIDDTGASPQLF